MAEALIRPNEAVVQIRDVTKVYKVSNQGRISAVHNLTLDVRRNEFLVITGRSGSGKTTVLNLAAGLTRPTTGVVLMEGINLWALSDREQALSRNQKVGFIFQFPSLLPSLTAQENIALPAAFGPSDARKDATDRAAHLLEMVGLADRSSALPRQLSAGQQKRVVIARALVNDPRIILADEATGDLDEETEQEIMALLTQIQRERGVTILLVTHNLDLVSYGTRSLEMRDGAIVAEKTGGLAR